MLEIILKELPEVILKELLEVILKELLEVILKELLEVILKELLLGILVGVYLFFILISMYTPAGISSLCSASTVFGVGAMISMSLL